MSREIFRSMVVPQTPGTAEDVLSRAAVGKRIKNDLVAQHNAQRSQLINNLEATKGQKLTAHNKLLRSAFPDHEDTSMEEYEDGYKQLINYFYPPFPVTEYRLDLSDRIPRKEKQAIFDPAIAAMCRLAASYGIALPQDLISRIFIVDGETFQNVYIQEAIGSSDSRDESSSTSGLTLSNRLCIINYDVVMAESKRQRRNPEAVLRASGIHELWHSVVYAENWVPTETTPESLSQLEKVRRHGFFTRRPGKLSKESQSLATSDGLSILAEGCMEYLTRETLALVGEKMPGSSYNNDLKVVETLIKSIGEDHFFQAAFTKEGFGPFYRAFTRVYGNHEAIVSSGDNALPFIAKSLCYERAASDLCVMENGRRRPYRKLMQLIQGNK